MALNWAEIKARLSNVFEPLRKNPITLAGDSNLDNTEKPMTVADKNCPIHISEDKVRILNLEGDAITVKGNDVLTGIVDGQVIGYTYLQTSGTTHTTFALETSMTVEDSTHQISFTAPPSGNVEIQVTFFVYRTSTSDVSVRVGLSDNSTYNSVSTLTEYDVGYGISASDDEAPDMIETANFIVTGLDPGTAITYYIGFSSSDGTAIYLAYGYRSVTGLSYAPFTIQATALPSTIYTG